MSRPFPSCTIDELEQLAEHADDVDALKHLLEELSHRKTNRALALRGTVEAKLSALASRTRRGANLFAGELLKLPDREIVNMINDNTFSDSHLTNRDAWRRICQARARLLEHVNEQAWSNVCARRGFVMTTFMDH